ncbi:MAG TPA: RNA-guided pseudouridylation complex pseudouridine synthase subunit Cbf5 [Candidatus Nanoarchaeia archaeon]|nr:RNA-guided pseudouridylation complex pseudouridine synthase subunit Cbf5 [Candidatus Nanoarchaeia archaeon]
MHVFTKHPAETNPAFGKSPDKRSVEELIDFGLIVLDKPAGPTSHQASDFVQRILNITKAGHGGSLDPNVTGVLPITLSNATRLSQVFLKGGKEYIGIMHIHKPVEEELIRKIQKTFIGKIMQLPPIRSAVKRQLRQREIYTFDILEIIDKDVLFRVSCEAGTYIRKLCTDFGDALKTGAHMLELRRTRASHLTENLCFTLQDIKDAYTLWKTENDETFIRRVIHPAEKMVEHLPKVWIMDTTIESVCHGRDVAIPGISKFTEMEKSNMVAIMSLKNELVAIGTAQMTDKDIAKNAKGIAVRTEKVFMKPGLYKTNT